jgi:hypothetical protein
MHPVCTYHQLPAGSRERLPAFMSELTDFLSGSDCINQGLKLTI